MTVPTTRGFRWLGFPYRVIYFLMLVIISSGLLPAWAGPRPVDALPGLLVAPAPVFLAAGLAFSFLIVYRSFLGDLFRYLVNHPVQAAILIVVVMIKYGLLGTSYGLPSL